MSATKLTVQSIKILLDQLSLDDKKELMTIVSAEDKRLMIESMPVKDVMSNIYALYDTISDQEVIRKITKAKNLYEAARRLSKDKEVREILGNECIVWIKDFINNDIIDNKFRSFDYKIKNACLEGGPGFDEVKRMYLSLYRHSKDDIKEDDLNDDDWYLYVTGSVGPITDDDYVIE